MDKNDFKNLIKYLNEIDLNKIKNKISVGKKDNKYNLNVTTYENTIIVDFSKAIIPIELLKKDDKIPIEFIEEKFNCMNPDYMPMYIIKSCKECSIFNKCKYKV